MKRSTNGFLTTHVGSLPRPESLVRFMIAEDQGEAFDEAVFEAALTAAVDDVIARQKSLGIDTVIVNGRVAVSGGESTGILAGRPARALRS